MTNNTYQVSSSINRRTFLGACAAAGVGTMVAMAGCAAGQGAPAEEEASAADGQAESAAAPEAAAPEPEAPTLDSIRQDVAQLGKDAAALLPPADPDPDNPFGIDKNINMTTIDQYLNLPGVAYRDARMLMDPARYEEIGGHANMDMTLEGFKVVPFPYVGTTRGTACSRWNGAKMARCGMRRRTTSRAARFWTTCSPRTARCSSCAARAAMPA